MLNFKHSLRHGLQIRVDSLPEKVDARLRRRIAPSKWRAWRGPIWSMTLAVVATTAVWFVIGKAQHPMQHPLQQAEVGTQQGLGLPQPSKPALADVPVDEQLPNASDGRPVPSKVQFADNGARTWQGTLSENELRVDKASESSASVVVGTTAIVARPGSHIVLAPNSGQLNNEPLLHLLMGTMTMQVASLQPVRLKISSGQIVVLAGSAVVHQQINRGTIEMTSGSGQFVDNEGRMTSLGAKVFSWSERHAGDGAARVLEMKTAPTAATPTVPAQDVEALTRTVDTQTPNVRPGPIEQACTFKSECGTNQTCRKNDRGAHVCMGGGGMGASCWFDADCAHGTCSLKRCVVDEATKNEQ
jgi:hypothetical protein